MQLLVGGVALWYVAHLFKRIAPAARAALTSAIGTGPARGVMALLLLASLVMIVMGYKRAPYQPIYDFPYWGIYFTHVLMFVSIVFLVMSFWGGFAKHYFRHPMLISVAGWAVAHLFVNGDTASLILFGSMWFWAMLEIVLINRAEPNWKPAPRGTFRDDVRLVIVALSVYAVVTGLHELLGVSPFTG
jgi:uncharacterized membrane protein